MIQVDEMHVHGCGLARHALEPIKGKLTPPQRDQVNAELQAANLRRVPKQGLAAVGHRITSRENFSPCYIRSLQVCTAWTVMVYGAFRRCGLTG